MLAQLHMNLATSLRAQGYTYTASYSYQQAIECYESIDGSDRNTEIMCQLAKCFRNYATLKRDLFLDEKAFECICNSVKLFTCLIDRHGHTHLTIELTYQNYFKA